MVGQRPGVSPGGFKIAANFDAHLDALRVVGLQKKSGALADEELITALSKYACTFLAQRSADIHACIFAYSSRSFPSSAVS